MLQSMRNSAKSWVVSVLFGLLILSFAIWGIGDIFRGGGQESVVAEIGNVEISRTEFAQEYQRAVNQIQQNLGGQFTPEQLNRLTVQMAPRIVAQIAERTLFDLAAQDLGILVPDEAVAAAIRNDPNLNSGIGGFNKAYYEQILRNIGFTPAAYEARLRRDMGRSLLEEAVTASEIVPKTLSDRLYTYRSQRRVVDILRVKADVDAVETPDQSATEAWYKDHGDSYMAPAYRAFSAIVVRPEDLMADIHVDEEQLKLEYSNRTDEFTVPEKRSATQLFYADEETAKKAFELLKEGKSFKEAAAETGNEQGEVELGTMTRAQAFPELVDAIFALEKDAYTRPLRSPLGWHIVKVNKIEAGSVKPFEEARKILEHDMKKDQAVDLLYELTANVEDELSGGATIQEAGDKLGLKVTKVEAVDAQGNGPDGKAVSGLPDGPEFLRTVFATGEGLESDLVETETDTAFIVKVDKIIAPALRPLDEVRDKVIAAWKQDQARERARKTANEMADALKGGQSIVDVAGKHGMSATTTRPFTRSGEGVEPALPAALVQQAFETDKDGVVVVTQPEGVSVVKVVDILKGDPDKEKEIRDSLNTEIVAALGNDLMAQFSNALRQTYPVDINQRAIDQALQP